MGGRKGVFSTPAGEVGAREHPLASDALEVSANSVGAEPLSFIDFGFFEHPSSLRFRILAAVMCSLCP